MRLLYCPVIGLLLSSLLLFAGAHSAGPTQAHDADPETTLSPDPAPGLSELTGEMKVGHLHFAVEELSVPVAGMPIRLLRTAYSYHPAGEHYLKTITDALGVPVVTYHYDPDDANRLIGIEDADGEWIRYTHDIAGRVELIDLQNKRFRCAVIAVCRTIPAPLRPRISMPHPTPPKRST